MQIIKTKSSREILQYFRAASPMEINQQIAEFMLLTQDERQELLMYFMANNSASIVDIINAISPGSIEEKSAEIKAS